MKEKKHRKKKRPFFSPDAIATKIAEGFDRDTSSITQTYDACTPAIRRAVVVQSRDLRKKYLPENCSLQSLREKAFAKFEATNGKMLEANIRFLEMHPVVRGNEFPGSVIQSDDTFRDKVLNRAKFLILDVLGDFTMEELYLSSKHSSGSTTGVSFLDTSLERKLRYPMTATSRVGPLMDDYLLFDSHLKSALDSIWGHEPTAQRYDFVDGSRATTVRKNAENDRFICPEPTANMFFQQGMMGMMYNRMKRKKCFLNVTSLPKKHKWLARIGSISGANATIDWSSASDCCFVELVRFLFPPKWFDMLDRLRSPKIYLGEKELVPQMISSMGNAGTFPVETLIFWSLGVAMQYTLTHKDNRLRIWYKPHSISVFGDDCITPSWMATQYIEFLSQLGFMVNDDKSFYGTENFRESCGGDYYHGYNVRPFTLKAPTARCKSALEPWLYISMNAFIPRYISYFGTRNWVYERELFRCFETLFVEFNLELKVVPHNFPDDAGLKVHFDLERFLLCYPGFLKRISKIVVNQHGQYEFRFCRYVYKQPASPRHEWIRYADKLKSSYMPPIPVMELENPERKGGGYVVAKTLEYAHWVVPNLKRYGPLSSGPASSNTKV
jgi:hypothetical protein